jgi:hypothetical protein
LRCGCREESVLHAFWYCKAATQVWKYTFLYNVYKDWKEPSFLDLFNHVATEFSKDELDCFAVTAWWIWKHRNEANFGQVKFSGANLAAKAHDWMLDFHNAHATVADPVPLPNLTEQHIKWWPS